MAQGTRLELTWKGGKNRVDGELKGDGGKNQGGDERDPVTKEIGIIFRPNKEDVKPYQRQEQIRSNNASHPEIRLALGHNNALRFEKVSHSARFPVDAVLDVIYVVLLVFDLFVRQLLHQKILIHEITVMTDAPYALGLVPGESVAYIKVFHFEREVP